MLTVSGSNNSSCLSAVTQAQWFFFLNPDTISLCEPVNISWENPQGSVYLPLFIEMRTDAWTLET